MVEKEPVCSCGKETNCMITGFCWLCKDCFSARCESARSGGGQQSVSFIGERVILVRAK